MDRICDQIEKKTIVVLDNAPIHRSKKFKDKISEWEERDLYVFFITPYSPELNIIEMLWKQMKYYWLEFNAYNNYEALEDCINKILKLYGSKYVINYA